MWCFNNKKSTIKFAPKLLTILRNMSSSNSTDSLTTAALKASASFAKEVERGQQKTKTTKPVIANSTDSLTTTALKASASFAKEVERGQQTTNAPVDIFLEFDTPKIRALTEETLRVHDQFMKEVMRNQGR